MTEPSGHPPWERLMFWLIAVVIGLQLLASVLPRLVPSLIVVAVIVAALRLIWRYTQL